MYAGLMLKTCSGCKVEKEQSEFYKRKASPDGLAYLCRQCDSEKHAEFRAANKESLAVKQKKWREDNKEHVAATKRKSKFGLSAEEQNAMLVSQNYCCAICKVNQVELIRRLAIDHDHDTKVIRGMLCDKCNRGIGLLQDSISILETAVKYLKKYQK